MANQAVKRRIAKENKKGGSRRGTDGRPSSHSVKEDDRREESPSSKGQGGP